MEQSLEGQAGCPSGPLTAGAWAQTQLTASVIPCCGPGVVETNEDEPLPCGASSVGEREREGQFLPRRSPKLMRREKEGVAAKLCSKNCPEDM